MRGDSEEKPASPRKPAERAGRLGRTLGRGRRGDAHGPKYYVSWGVVEARPLVVAPGPPVRCCRHDGRAVGGCCLCGWRGERSFRMDEGER